VGARAGSGGRDGTRQGRGAGGRGEEGGACQGRQRSRESCRVEVRLSA
jgi:hypothetical protein